MCWKRCVTFVNSFGSWLWYWPACWALLSCFSWFSTLCFVFSVSWKASESTFPVSRKNSPENSKKNMAGKEYPSSHNHGSGKWDVSNFTFLSFSVPVIFHFHDYGRKGIDLEKVRPFTREYVCCFCSISPPQTFANIVNKKTNNWSQTKRTVPNYRNPGKHRQVTFSRSLDGWFWG